jgi:hypothetical protein
MKYILFSTAFFVLSSFYGSIAKCQDLLVLYGEKPANLELVESNTGTGQVVAETRYKVSGENALKIEQYFIEKCGMGQLKFKCCGWESEGGKNGFFEHEGLKKVNANYQLEVSMYGHAERKNEKGEIYLESDRTKIDFFVVVKVLDV